MINQGKYQIIGQKDTKYDSLFYTIVKLTGIFCLPFCKVKKSLKKCTIS
ncbi:hypothetical protein CP965_04540 [Halarcobacter mediterraneus]|uniref:Ada DNA repair metal-binding domain-containing protein n=1 Tax=Halarcobacter mediterraneus TaxID=2023153 RepID=A0A4Q1B4D2_9BACT|nr:hypothetical protein CP965_04540 [Halarcobacter mediterraneus]